MTGGAIRAITSVVFIVTAMAGDTILRRPFKDAIHMTLFTGYSHMRSGQFKSGEIVVESGTRPCIGCMTGSTICSKLTVVFIVTAVAGDTFLRRALKNVINMAAFAGGSDVCSGQLENREIVIKRSWFPGIGGMTCRTICAKTPCMRLIF